MDKKSLWQRQQEGDGLTRDHTFLDVNDYHRYHSPVSGTLRELRTIPGSQICSCNWLTSLHVGDHLSQGQEMGYFLFGGSDIIMIFQKGIDVRLLHKGNHLLMGEAYANLTFAKHQ